MSGVETNLTLGDRQMKVALSRIAYVRSPPLTCQGKAGEKCQLLTLSEEYALHLLYVDLDVVEHWDVGLLA